MAGGDSAGPRRSAPARYSPSGQYHGGVLTPPSDSPDWLAISSVDLPIAEAYAWAIRPDCGGIVMFSGTARDHSDGRPDVSVLEYEAYEEHVVPRLASIATEARARWQDLGRVVMIHRVGTVPVGESAVIVVVSAPHRDHAFAAARFAIDSLKASVPIWKREVWGEGESWGLEAQHIVDVGAEGPGGGS